MLKLENIQGGYTPGSLVLQGVDLQVQQGEVIGIIGLNGCGKSTLGKAVLNMLPFRTGKISLKGRDVSHLPVHHLHNFGIGMVMQGGMIFPHMSVWEHLQLVGKSKSEKDLKKRVSEIEEQYGLVIFAPGTALNRKGSFLSGGEKQQLALMMALLDNPEWLILDEVSAGLSPGNVSMVAELIKVLKTEGKLGIILMEQNIKLAVQLSDHLLLLERGVIDKHFVVDKDFDINNLNENIFN
ncbi:MAG: ATP-binding cassette domain-containing protein [Bacteroidetes bacterium]|nr:ATP-binding cassette domain-containing protein [Bacteroidota bacterium]